jgi:hypothetical protein
MLCKLSMSFHSRLLHCLGVQHAVREGAFKSGCMGGSLQPAWHADADASYLVPRATQSSSILPVLKLLPSS